MKSLIRRTTTPFGVIVASFLLLTITFVSLIVVRVNATSDSVSAGSRLLTIHDNGSQQAVLTDAATVGEALGEAGIYIDKSDAVEPALDEQLVASEYDVNIYRARPVTVVDGPTKSKIITPYQTAKQITASAGITLYESDVATLTRSDDIVSDGAGLTLTIDRATPFTLTLYGKTSEVRTQGETVGEMLAEKGLILGKDDRVSPDITSSLTAGLSVRVWREGKQTITVDEPVDFEIQKIQDGDQYVGYRAIKTPGQLGSRSVTYEVVIQDGQEVGRIEIASITTLEAQKQVEIVGAKSAYSSTLNEWLLALRTCETNGIYTRNSGNGFYGAYQFMISTWDAVAPKVGRPDLVGVRPDLASPSDQDFMVVANANLSKGGLATQHPGCYQKLGLSQFPPV